jgi:signal recognition particle subunit SRP54
MLETLTRGFQAGRDRFRGVTRLTEENVAEALGEVRRSLLEADVDLKVVREFLTRVQERILGEEVKLRSSKARDAVRVTPGDHFTKACFEELVQLMGEEAPLPKHKGTRVVLLAGLQGTGKTSTAAKLARHLKEAGERPLLVAADVHRPAAREQLRVLGEQIGVEVFTREGNDAPAICAEAVAHARAQRFDTVLLDTAGRLQIDEALMVELASVRERARPDHVILVCDAMAGREAVNVARGFAERLPLDGLILTKIEGDARGGAALAIRQATGVPIRYLTTGEGTDRLETFRPDGLASRILGMGDVVSLVQGFEKHVDQEKAAEDAMRMLQGSFGLDDFLNQLRTLRKMGPLKDLMEKLPGVSQMMPAGLQVTGDELDPIEAMILSMTPQERQRPDVINPSRAQRIARGSGRAPREVNELVDRFKAMQKLMGSFGQMAGGGLLGKIPGLGKMFGGGGGGGFPGLGGLMGGGGGMPSLDQLQSMGLGGMAPNRAAARAQKTEQQRKARKNKRKHQKRQKKKR